MSSAQLSAAFFLQLFFLLAVCRLVGILARRFGQPQVVGEMIAGVIMGPSLFGLLFPAVVLASFGGGPIIAVQAIAGGLLYAVLTLTIGRKLLKHLGVIAENKGKITPTLLAVTLMLLMLGSWTTDAVGIGLQKGLIQPALFSLMVMMAIVTTLMTSPLFELIRRTRGKADTEEDTPMVKA